MLPYRVGDRIRRAWFNFQCRSVLASDPIASTDLADVTVLTQIGHKDLLMYLAALKSFVRSLKVEVKVVVLDDGSLVESDRKTLVAHCRGIQIRPLSSVPPADCPTGNCWERLLLVCDLSSTSYVVQVDSDTLTIGPIPEVLAAISTNKSFTLLGDGSFPGIETFAQASLRYGGRNSQHVQVMAERAMGQTPGRDELYYVRGNAGFVGFGKGSFERADVERLSRIMSAQLGAKWHEWGSEQVMSNLVVANTSESVVLPFPAYSSYYAHPHVDYSKCSFVHFIGAKRFENNMYASQTRKLFPPK